MHPETARSLAEQRRAELAGLRRAARLRRPGRPDHRAGRHRAGGDGEGHTAGVLPDGPEAFAYRAYLTPAEARRLAAHWARTAGRFDVRLDDPARRPAGAVAVEVVVLARRLPDPVPAAAGRPPGGGQGPGDGSRPGGAR